MTRNLELDLLRSYVAVADLGSISAAARRVGRTQSAVSLQMDRLAEAVGFQVLERKGRTVVPTQRGGAFLDDARRLLDLNDQVLAQHVHGTFAQPLRLGFVQDVGEDVLERILTRISAHFPQAPVSVRVCATSSILDQLRAEELDVGVGFRMESDLPARPFLREPMLWIAARNLRIDRDAPVPLVLFEHPCVCRSAAVAALGAVGRASRVTFSSPSLPGLMAAVAAGMGVTVRSRRSLRPGLAVMGDLCSAPLPDLEFMLYGRPGVRPAALAKVEEILEEEIAREHRLHAAA
ncbi:LysR substrate-binding domain-containing protein [Xanthobacter tagetidis]|jgi:DNA-binding transcriptional LysR family regulator|uniref:LysR family transcriptional regulator n=1 Tax=Xanthobacter tagetidis TaxID=60216 RepID=A0A3L7ANU1_9HYPH|nr:LysR substrate-binding domain-containing protein [Xanthobacter tagetidis]MBB6308176.1 DNA-binding transcriptional LysR family regulator [Xanthobacter tagetidis]RLP81794.1 LysR family transcriptional regulator [Xanthobacter tagetidis]